jgi:hypothetical protein
MVDKTLTDIVTDNPIVTDLSGDEPFETVVSAASAGGKLRQLSFTPLNAQIVNYTLALTDQGKCVTMSNASARSITIPLNAAVAFPIGATVLVRGIGAGAVSISTAGIVIQQKATQSKILAAQYSQVALHKTGTDTWYLTGDFALL